MSKVQGMGSEFDVHDYDGGALYDPAFYGVEERITDEHFNLFHTIDRTLFYMLIRKLGRNVEESMHVVAFLIFLEKIRYSHDAVFKAIAWPLHLVHHLADEIAALLMCLMRTHVGNEYNINLFLLGILCYRDLNLVRFHQNRSKILENVRIIVVEVCARAFTDILTGGSEFPDLEEVQMWNDGNNPIFVPPPVLYPHVAGRFPQLGFGENPGPSNNYMPPSHQLANILEDPNADLSEIFGDMQLLNGCEDESDVAPDDRTIFLTFSRGYYIPEVEIREFFTRYFVKF